MDILIDLDNILVDTYKIWLKAYNLFYLPKGAGEVKIEDLTNFEMDKNKNVNGNIWKIIDSDGFFKDLPEIEGGVWAVEKLQKAGHNVIICSSPSKNIGSWTDKIYWIQNHLKIMSNKNIILTGSKQLVMADILIDDSPKNAYNWRKKNPKGIVAQINWPYNLNSVAQIKADSWEDTKSAWQTILGKIL